MELRPVAIYVFGLILELACPKDLCSDLLLRSDPRFEEADTSYLSLVNLLLFDISRTLALDEVVDFPIDDELMFRPIGDLSALLSP